METDKIANIMTIIIPLLVFNSLCSVLEISISIRGQCKKKQLKIDALTTLLHFSAPLITALNVCML